MEDPVSGPGLQAALLRLRLWLGARGPVACAALLLCVLAAGALAWLAPQRALQARTHQVALRLAATPPAPPRAPVATPNENLARFYATLGEKRYAEQQVDTLFALAAKNGIVLSQGEYRSAYDSQARVHTYQVTLPLKGSYGAIWQFGLQTLAALPFAALDDISFKRETIGEAQVEARLRLTLYLADQAPGAIE
jgi:hypothetical protein